MSCLEEKSILPSTSGGKREGKVGWFDHCSLDVVGWGDLTFISLCTISQSYTVHPLQTQEGGEGSLCGRNWMKRCKRLRSRVNSRKRMKKWGGGMMYRWWVLDWMTLVQRATVTKVGGNKCKCVLSLFVVLLWLNIYLFIYLWRENSNCWPLSASENGNELSWLETGEQGGKILWVYEYGPQK